MTSEIQWYIARDGKQYGPLSDPEMGLFVQGGHLRPTDLVWRAGFSDWLPALAAFPQLGAPPPPVPLPSTNEVAPAPRPGGPMQQPMYSGQPHAGADQAGRSLSGDVQTRQPAGQPRMSEPLQRAAAQPNPQQARTTYDNSGPALAGAASTPGTGAPAAVGGPQNGQSRGGQAGPLAAQTVAPSANFPSPGAKPATGQTGKGRSVVPIERGFPDDDIADEAVGTGRSRIGRLARIAAVVLVLAGGGWLVFQKRDGIKSFATAMVAGKSGRSVAIDPSIPAFVVEAGPASAIDARLQKTALWSVVKREFPDWYGERLTETAKLTSEKKSDADVTKHLLDALVALRRKHANDALAASNQRLLSIADAFLANLKRISSHSTTTCYSFISQGESSPAIVELVQTKGGDADLQAQVTAIFEAIAEGRKSPVKHATPDKTDYDALAEQLTRLGWSQADLQLFADPRALARTSHDRVCKMVQDWFSAHISVKDRAAQERLLIETLRPVVAG